MDRFKSKRTECFYGFYALVDKLLNIFAVVGGGEHCPSEEIASEVFFVFGGFVERVINGVLCLCVGGEIFVNACYRVCGFAAPNAVDCYAFAQNVGSAEHSHSDRFADKKVSFFVETFWIAADKVKVKHFYIS